MGRDKRNEARGEHFTKMHRSTMESAAWRALSPTAQALYPWIKLEWRGPKTNNNGRLRLSVRQAAERMGCNLKTAMTAFQDLQAKGFLIQTETACLGVKGKGKSAAYEATDIALPGEVSGRKLYNDWRPAHDFPVRKAITRSPNRRGQKTKPRSEKRNVVIPFSGTKP